MKITKITRQQRNSKRYSIFIDGTYTFSLSEEALLSSKITQNQELDSQQVRELKLLANDDQLYGQAFRYLAIRSRTKWEITQYLQRKHASPTLISSILNKLSNVGLIDDTQYVKDYIHDRQLIRPTSRRKIIFELRKKHVPDDIIKVELSEQTEDKTALISLINRKRQQSRYQDDLKLMQYLSRQGFNYGDIKEALASGDAKP